MNLITRMSNDLMLSADAIEKIAFNSDKYYRIYTVTKKNGSGEKRTIYHPSPKLKCLQYWIVYNILKKFPYSPYSMAYEPKCSIKKNALIHKNAKHILHLDIRNFFETITKEHIEKTLLKDSELSSDDKEVFYGIVLFNGHLVIGSVASPAISNRVMYGLDLEIHSIATKYGNLKYTRYADDLIFSSPNYIQKEIIIEVETVLNKYGFELNHRKTSFMSSATRKMVTGLTIDNGRVTVGHRLKRRIKSMVYNKLEHNDGNANVIRGYLSFLKGIEPDYFDKIIIKYSNYGNVLELLANDSSGSSPSKQTKEEAAVTVNAE